MPSNTPSGIVRLAEYRVPDFLVETVDLTFDLDEAFCRVTARLALVRNPAAASPAAALRLDGGGQPLIAIALDGVALAPERYRLEAASLIVDEVPDAFELEIETRLQPQDNTELSGLYKSGGNFTTQCEAEGFRRITYFPDRPDVMARYSTTIIADAARYPVLLSNGNPAGSGDAGGGRHWARWQDPHPKPSYLFALVAGDLVSVDDRFVTRSGREIALAIHVRRGDEDRCGHAMRSLKASMTWDEDVYGLEYDLDVFNIVAVGDFNAGAMENKGLNIFNTKYVLARPETATDANYQAIEAVIGHEYFHNWTGNRVTCRDWFQLSLKEGLTVFRDQEFSADLNSRAVKRIADVRSLRASQFPEDAGPLAHPVRPDSYREINNFFTATVYLKGAEVVRMIHTLIGAAAWRRGMDLYIARHDNSAATIEDFAAAMQDASGVDLSLFRRWYHQAGTPELEVSEDWDPAAGRYTLTVAQQVPATPGQPDKQPMLIPLAMGLLAPDGSALPTRLEGEKDPLEGTRVLQVAEAVQSFRFVGLSERPIPSLLRGFSAPVKLKHVPLDRLKFLAAHDSDPFQRWEAGQQAATRALLDLAAAWRRGETLVLDPDLVRGLRRTVETGTDPAFVAQVLALPAEAFLADQMAVVDVEAIHQARRFAMAEIGRVLEPLFTRTYDSLTGREAYRPDAASIGRRALRNAALVYLASSGTVSARALLQRQFDAQANMTDVLAALALLADIDCPEREAAFAAFYQTWHHDDLVIDNWFALQARSSLPGTLDQVRALALHPAFDMRKPNRVHALVGAFCSANPVHFHAADGGGYDFLADWILQLDPINGQIAAGLVRPLGAWRRFDDQRQARMKQALERVLAQPGLGNGTLEQAGKSLG